MSVFYKGNKVASGGGTTNVTAHQFTNTVTDIKANASSGSLGVLDTIARADHVHPFSDAETFAEAERVKSNNASYGAIVHEKQIENVQRVVLLYDKDSTDANINKGYTSGFVFDGGTNSITLTTDATDYIGMYIYIHCYNHRYLHFFPMESGTVRSTITVPYGSAENLSSLDDITFNIGKVGITGAVLYAVNAVRNNNGTTSSLNNDSDYYISKVLGVKV